MKLIPVSRPALPPLNEYSKYLETIWESGNLTSGVEGAPLVKKLENALASYFGVSECVLMCNATLALEAVLRTLRLRGKVLTTPFTYVATSSAIVNAGCTPFYCDIRGEDFNLDAVAMEKILPKEISALVPVHVFGQPCEVEQITRIAQQFSLPVIYDAAHCFGSRYGGTSVFKYGTASILSMQSTKVFQTGEGGAVFTGSSELAEKLRKFRIFGLSKGIGVNEIGTNAKLSELHAAMGLALLPYMQEVLEARRECVKEYRRLLSPSRGFRFQKIQEEETNYSYFSILFEKESTKEKVRVALEEMGISTRQYFYPSLEEIACFSKRVTCQQSYSVSRRILSLPLYWQMPRAIIQKVSDTIQELTRGEESE